MSTSVTVRSGAGTTVTVPFTSSQVAAAAQAAAFTISKLVSQNVLAFSDFSATGQTIPAPLLFGGLTLSGTTGTPFTGLIPTGYKAIVENGSAFNVAIGSTDSNQTVIGGTGGIAYVNLATNASVYLNGGGNAVYEEFASSSALVDIGASSIGGVAAFIQATQGATTVNAFSGALMQINGSDATVNAMSGNEVVILGAGSSTVPVQVNGASGSNLTMFNDGQAAVINPGAGNLTIVANATDVAETVFGGAATIGGNAVSAPAFTGTLLAVGFTSVGGLSGVSGYYQGGSAGHNVMLASNTAGAATLIGGGSGDYLIANAGGDYLQAVGAATTLQGALGVASAVGGTFVTGSNTALIYGDLGGHDTFSLGSGNSTVTGLNGNNTYELNGHGAAITINNFLVGSDTFSRTKSAGNPTISTLGATGSNTGVQLSDHTTVTFVGATVTSSSFT